MDKPTEEQTKEFWEWCGFKLKRMPRAPDKVPFYVLYKPDGEQYNIWFGRHPSDKLSIGELYPNINLNNLFKYAVPKLFEMGYWIKTSHSHSIYDTKDSHSVEIGQHKYTGGGNHICLEDPALALFWALWQALEKELKDG